MMVEVIIKTAMVTPHVCTQLEGLSHRREQTTCDVVESNEKQLGKAKEVKMDLGKISRLLPTQIFKSVLHCLVI